VADADHERPERLMTLRLRLTLWVVVIAAVVQLTVAFVGLLFHANSIRSLYDDQLRMRAEEIVQSLPPNPADVSPERLRSLAQNSSLLVSFDRVRVAIFDMRGNIVAFDPENPPPNEAGAVRRSIESREGAYADWMPPHASNGSPRDSMRSYAMPVSTIGGGLPGVVLWIATSDEYADRQIRSARWSVSIALLAGMLGSGIAGWFIAGIAVRPLEQIHSAVRSLSPGHSSMELSDDGEDPEVTRLRQELDDAVARIEAGYAAYGRFIANVSHELKTPIAVALTEAEVLLADRSIEEKPRRFARSIAEEMARLGRLIESFLTLTRTREGQLNKGLRDYPVNELIMDSIEHCWPIAQQHSIVLTPTLLDTDGPSDVCVDPDLMRTAIDNLIRNAIRFSPEGARVEVSAGVTLDDSKTVISVRDYGPGIPGELLAVLFDRFAQAETETRAGRGTGLGLEIAQGIAEIHNGEITVENLSSGCVFRLFIPLVGPKEACDPGPGQDE
jgi:signal transduction histidine kinase